MTSIITCGLSTTISGKRMPRCGLYVNLMFDLSSVDIRIASMASCLLVYSGNIVGQEDNTCAVVSSR